jgi:hypothetical protein
MSATPEQLYEMLQYCIGFARTMLERAGEFHPFGARVSVDGRVAAVGGYNGEEHPAAADIYKLLSEAFRNGAKSAEYLGVAVAANVNIPTQYSSAAHDGLRVHLESLGYALRVRSLQPDNVRIVQEAPNRRIW